MIKAKNETIKMAIVGYGGMGGWHEKNIANNIPDIEVVGVFDILESQQEKARQKGLIAYESLDALLADAQLDLVLIATPNDYHRDIAVAAMDRGKHVISEKPVTISSADLEIMIEAANRNNVLFTVHQNRRWDKDYLIAKKIYDDNTLGNVFQIESRVHGSRGIPGDWRGQKAHGGGMVFDWGIHLLDQILMLKIKNKVKSVYAHCTHITNMECDDGFQTILTFDDDCRVLVEVGTNNFIELPRWYLLGENGSAIIENWNRDGKIVMVSDWENRDAVPIQAGEGLTKTMAPRTDDSIQTYDLPQIAGEWTDYYRNIVQVLRGQAQPLITHDQVRRSMKVMEAIFESHNTGNTVKTEI
jgi:predicted dehydrogenase